MVMVDATVMQIPATGVAKSTLRLYEACLRLHPELRVASIHRRRLQCTLPAQMKSLRRGTFLPSGVWRSVFLPWYLTLKRPVAVHFPWNGNVPSCISNTKVITTLHDVLPLVIPNHFPSAHAEELYRKKVQDDIDRTDLLITISEYSKAEIVKNFRVNREPVVIPHGPTLTSHAVTGKPAAAPGDYFIYVGGYDPRKGIESLLRVFVSLHRQGRVRSTLVLTGSRNYYSSELQHTIAEGVAMGVVEERGYISDQELGSLLRGAKALVYPSKFEGFGLPPLEAMSLGCPVIAVQATSIPEVCGDAACYVDPDDDRSFSEALVAMETSDEIRQEFTNRGLKNCARFSWEASAEAFMGAIEALKA